MEAHRHLIVASALALWTALGGGALRSSLLPRKSDDVRSSMPRNCSLILPSQQVCWSKPQLLFRVPWKREGVACKATFEIFIHTSSALSSGV